MPTPASTVGSDISVLYSGVLFRALMKKLRFSEAFNRDYEGEITKQGDTMVINTTADPTISDYSRNTDMTIETLGTTAQALVINQAKKFNIGLDDVDDKQTAAKLMPERMKRAAYKMADTCDQFQAATLAAGVATANQLSAATSVGTGAGDNDPFELIVDMGVILDNNFVEEEGRWLFLPPWYCGELLKDPRRSSFGTTENLKAYGSGYIGLDPVSGFEIFKSVNVPVSNGAYTIIGGVKSAATFGEQILKYETLRNPLRFGDIHRGLHVYGATVTAPNRLVSVVATQHT